MAQQGDQAGGTANRVALVTGGTRGLGKAITLDLLNDGWTVVICGRRPPETPVMANAREAEFHSCDVRQASEVEALVEGVRAKHGRLDLLVNNAGGSPETPAGTASPRFSEAIVGLNLMAPLHLSRAAYPIMEAQAEGGSIVNIASISGLRPSPGSAAYSAAKAGLLMLTQALAMEWAPSIRVNAIIVGLLETDSAAEGHYGGDEGLVRIAEKTMPIKRLVKGQEVANVVRFLASSQAESITGAQIAVHGGGEIPAYVHLAEG